MRPGSLRHFAPSIHSTTNQRPRHSSRSNRSFTLPNLAKSLGRHRDRDRGGGESESVYDGDADAHHQGVVTDNMERNRSRRERTFTGNSCAVCEEPLEHTLRGERILQFSCSHVSHEACFYEYIKEFESQYCPTCSAPLGLDTSRGGNVLDLEKLSSIVRAVSISDAKALAPGGGAGSTMMPDSHDHDHHDHDLDHDYDRDFDDILGLGTGPAATSAIADPGRTSSLSGSRTKRRPSRREHAQNATQQAPLGGSATLMQRSSGGRELPDRGSRRCPDLHHPAPSPGPGHGLRDGLGHAHHRRSPSAPSDFATGGPPDHDRYLDNFASSAAAASSTTPAAAAAPRNSHRSNSRSQPRQIAAAAALAGRNNNTTAKNNNTAAERDPHNADSASMAPRAAMPSRNPIPAPIVTVKSEFPTINRSNQQQAITCLVSIEVPAGKWALDEEDVTPATTAPAASAPVHAPAAAEYSAPEPVVPLLIPYEDPVTLREVTEDLRLRVENWHNLDFQRFGKPRLYSTIKVGKDGRSWQELECYLFSEMLICVKEKKGTDAGMWDGPVPKHKRTRCTLKGSILIKKHLKGVIETDDDILTLSLSVIELPSFHLQFNNPKLLEAWKRALAELNSPEAPLKKQSHDVDDYEDEDEDYKPRKTRRESSQSMARKLAKAGDKIPSSLHVPVDVVVVVPITSSMQGMKISLLRDTLRFLVQNLGEGDRMGLVTFGSSSGGTALVSMAGKNWRGWEDKLAALKPVGQKSLRADVVDGANVAMDMLMQRKTSNPISSIMLISDSATSDTESVDFVSSRAEAAKVTIHSFGLGLTHKPDTLIELSTRTKASYMYVKDYWMLRECAGGVLGSLQSTSHQNVKLNLKLPEGANARFVKISGALAVTKRASGRDAEASLGDFRFGDRRDVLVQLVIAGDEESKEEAPKDAWENIVSGLEALGGPIDPDEDARPLSIEEVPLLQADLSYGDILRHGQITHPPRPSLLAITMLPPAAPKSTRSSTAEQPVPQLPANPTLVQRRMELLTSDMLTRALTLIARGHNDRAAQLLRETRTVLRNLSGGTVPLSDQASIHESINPASPGLSSVMSPGLAAVASSASLSAGTESPITTVLLSILDEALEWIAHPAIFARDSRKAILQVVGVISSQRAYTLRSGLESIYAERVPGVKEMGRKGREWREGEGSGLVEGAENLEE